MANTPLDVIIEEVKRLPVKSLLRHKTISEEWKTFICSRIFIKVQREFSTFETNFNRHKIMLHCGMNTMKQFNLSLFLHGVSRRAEEVDTMGRFITSFVGSCNGILCCLMGRNLNLYNPATREWRTDVPNYDDQDNFGSCQTFGFGYNEENNDYIIVAIMEAGRTAKTKCYSLKSNTWSLAEDCPLVPKHSNGAFFNQKLYWLSRDTKMMAVLDVETMLYDVLPIPEGQKVGRFHRNLGATENLLYLFANDFEYGKLWTLQDGCWDLKANICYRSVGFRSNLITLLYVWKDGMMAIKNELRFFLYDPTIWPNGAIREVEVYNAEDCTSGIAYVESLVIIHEAGELECLSGGLQRPRSP